jgi:hypothetical protein
MNTKTLPLDYLQLASSHGEWMMNWMNDPVHGLPAFTEVELLKNATGILLHSGDTGVVMSTYKISLNKNKN